MLALSSLLATAALLSRSVSVSSSSRSAMTHRCTAVDMGVRLAVVYPLPDMDKLDAELSAAADASELAIVKFSKPRCPACMAIAPRFDQLARNSEHLRLFEVNSLPASGKAIAKQAGVRALPSIAIYRNGEQVWCNAVVKDTWSAFAEAVAEQEALL